ncbi:MAG TPA: hypothetical protein GXZ64_02770 [Clostridiaceae bacterium]|nr:hypothetical protein [Clostridiaceae bacterium]
MNDQNLTIELSGQQFREQIASHCQPSVRSARLFIHRFAISDRIHDAGAQTKGR